MLHDAAKSIPLDVRDWGETDSTYPREIVEIVIALVTPAVAEILAHYIRQWMEERKVKEVEVIRPDGTAFGATDMRPDELAVLAEYLWASRRTVPVGSAQDRP
jgi:hypothetical protein